MRQLFSAPYTRSLRFILLRRDSSRSSRPHRYSPDYCMCLNVMPGPFALISFAISHAIVFAIVRPRLICCRTRQLQASGPPHLSGWPSTWLRSQLWHGLQASFRPAACLYRIETVPSSSALHRGLLDFFWLFQGLETTSRSC